ncbi:unnamed protein product [Boreogadus saida]
MSEPSEQDFPKEHGFSKKLLINCCLVRRIIMWATPAPKESMHYGSVNASVLLSERLFAFTAVTNHD